MAEANRFHGTVKDYVAYKLRKNDIFLDGFNENVNPSHAALHLRTTTDEFIEDNRHFFDSTFEQLQFSQTTTYSKFMEVADELFQSGINCGINWGRIVAFLAFGATLAVYCAQREDLASLVNNIVGWLSTYMEQNLGEWIDEQGHG